MSLIDLKSSNQTVLTCAGILFCSLIFVFHPCEEPDQRRMLIVFDNFKGKNNIKKILSCKKTRETFIHGKQTFSAINRCVVI